MASKEVVKQLLDDLKQHLSDYDVRKIAEKTPQDNRWNYQGVLAKLLASGDTTKDSIIDAISNYKDPVCGYCTRTWIPAFDEKQWIRDGKRVIDTTINIPTILIPCPNCAKHKSHALSFLQSQSEIGQGYSFAILYQFINDKTPMPFDQFSISKHWQGLYSWNPSLTVSQLDLLKWIQTPVSKHVEKIKHVRQAVNEFISATMMGKKLQHLPE